MYADTIFTWRADAHELDLRNRSIARNFEFALTPIEQAGLIDPNKIESAGLILCIHCGSAFDNVTDCFRHILTWHGAD